MELLCPECLGTLVTADGQTARCSVHGGEYQILFSRWRPPPPPPILQATPTEASPGPTERHSIPAPPPVVERPAGPPVQLMPAPDAMCAQHGTVPAVVACQICTRPMCMTCAFQDADGTQLCLECVSRGPAVRRTGLTAAPPQVGPAVPMGVHCVQHPHLQATAQCQSCGAFMCGTCDFQLPGGIHVCPACATAPKTKLSDRRRNLVTWSYVLAVWSTLGMALLLGGAFASMASDQAGTRVLDVALHFLLLVPSLVGTALAVSARERRLGNPPAVWIAIGWNALLLGTYVLLSFVGVFSG
jgi:hypothetical protein